jgi:hypothetical protein
MTHEPPPADVTISEISDRLAVRFPSIPIGTIREAVSQAYDELSDARVRDFVEVLVEKQAKKALKQLSD